MAAKYLSKKLLKTICRIVFTKYYLVIKFKYHTFHPPQIFPAAI